MTFGESKEMQEELGLLDSTRGRQTCQGKENGFQFRWGELLVVGGICDIQGFLSLLVPVAEVIDLLCDFCCAMG